MCGFPFDPDSNKLQKTANKAFVKQLSTDWYVTTLRKDGQFFRCENGIVTVFIKTK